MTTASFIVVNWNGKDLLEKCLRSIYRQKGDFEVILVDNASGDGSIDYVHERFPSTIVVALPENRGFSGGNNAGYALASGRYIALVNTDVTLDDSWLEAMVAAMEDHPAVGICASRIIKSATGMLDSEGDYLTTAFTVCRPGEDRKPEPVQDGVKVRIVPGACAAAAFYRAGMIEEIGLFDEEFFLNHEDTDLNLRALVTGWECLLVPRGIAFHDVSASIGVLSDTAVYFFARNSLWVWLKNVPTSLIIMFFFHRVLYEIAAALAFCVIHRKGRAYLRGKVDSIKMFPQMLDKRQAVQHRARVPAKDIRKMLRPLRSYLLERLRCAF